jgi:hypothetical protein
LSGERAGNAVDGDGVGQCGECPTGNGEHSGKSRQAQKLVHHADSLVRAEISGSLRNPIVHSAIKGSCCAAIKIVNRCCRAPAANLGCPRFHLFPNLRRCFPELERHLQHYCFGQLLEERVMRVAMALALAAGVGFAVPAANAEEARIGVGVGPVGAGVTVGESHDRDRDRDRTTVIKRESEPRERTTIIKREREEPSNKVIIKERD